MTRLCVVVTCAFVLLSNQALAAEKGTIVGRVLNATTGRPEAKVRVTLSGANVDGSDPITKVVTTDRTGRYSFKALATGEERLYTLDAIYERGFFPSRAVSLPSDTDVAPVIETTLRVWPTTTDPAAVLITRDDMFAVLGRTGIGIIESVTVVNQTDMAYIGRGSDRTAWRDIERVAPSLGFSLPVDCRSAGVSIVDSELDVPQLRCTDFGFAVTTAIPPGEMRTTFSYDIPGDTGTFNMSRTALYDIAEMSIFAADPLEVDSNRLTERGEVTLAGKTYRRWTSRSPIDPGDTIQVVATAEARWTTGLIAGIGAVLVVIAGLLVFAFRRRKRTSLPDPVHVDEDLVRAIAALDVAYERGDLAQEEWTQKRHELKTKLEGANR